ncbi:MAG: hypothetical protein U5R31_06940 [Acidimicrobiia bacterium]|nr:hypothetical protein [Acidimicrobiia bacterium]
MTDSGRTTIQCDFSPSAQGRRPSCSSHSELLGFDDLLAVTVHHHAPTGLVHRVGEVDLEGDRRTPDRGTQLRPRRAAEDHAVVVHGVVDREDHRLPADDGGDPPEPVRRQEPEARRPVEHLDAGVRDR